MKKKSLITALLILLTMVIYGQDWLNSTQSQNGSPLYRTGKVGIGTWYFPDASGAWYGQGNGPMLELNGTSLIGNTHLLASSTSGASGTSLNSTHWIRHNNWFVRTGSASPWA